MKKTLLLIFAMVLGVVAKAQITWSDGGFGVVVPDRVDSLNVTIDTDSLKQLENKQVTLALEMTIRDNNYEADLAQFVGQKVLGMKPHDKLNMYYQTSWSGLFNGVLVDTKVYVDDVEKCYTLLVVPVYYRNHYAVVSVYTDVESEGVGADIASSYFTLPVEKPDYEGSMFQKGDGTVLYRELYRSLFYSLGMYKEDEFNGVMSQMANAFQSVYGVSTQAFLEEQVEPEVTVLAKGVGGVYLCRVAALQNGDHVLALYAHNEEVGQIPFSSGICELNTSPEGETSYRYEDSMFTTVLWVGNEDIKLDITPKDETLEPVYLNAERIKWTELFE